MFKRSNSVFVMALFSVLALAAALGCSGTVAPPANSTESAGEPSSTSMPENIDLPLSLDDPRCRNVRGVSNAATGTDFAFLISNRASTVTDAVQPLSTATPHPGTVQVNGHADLSGGSVACFEMANEGSLSFGGTHDYGMDLLLRLSLRIPEGLTLDSRVGPELIENNEWSTEFTLRQPTSRSVSTRNRSFSVTSSNPGKYEVVLQSEWVELENETPIDAPNQTETKTFTYYVVPD